MLCLSLTSFINCKQLRLNENYVGSRIYVGNEEASTFPNRLVFKTTRKRITKLIQEEIDPDGRIPWVQEELSKIQKEQYITVPFIIRTQDEAHTSFKKDIADRHRKREFNFGCGLPTLVINSMVVPNLCSGCSRSLTLKGKKCPDYVEDSYSCLKAGMITLERSAFYLTDKGELSYAISNGDSNEQ